MGHFVTWSKKDDEASCISRKVDRALANCKCFGSLPLSESEVEFTPKGLSDHSACVVRTGVHILPFSTS